ncbi:MAG: hypothetical protein DHS20C11_19910 [Lysobacteraceae bacterium]|nr:MAG: hypothetical protein DHS20C11_19910 [Xanthomonadaceae bacterium]
MADTLPKLILSLTPEDGSSIGNGAMMALLRERMPELADDDYFIARDSLVDDGVLITGKGRGGSISRVMDSSEASDADSMHTNTNFELEEQPATNPTKNKRKSPSPSKKKAQSKIPKEVISYRHSDKRLNNPQVGMVHANTDPDGQRQVWAYDPHLDPTLNFDSARASLENLIDDALASDDPEQMKEALGELKRLQAPYLNWTGKAEKTSFEVDTVSLHVHERVDPATILANATKRLKGKNGTEAQAHQPDLFAAPFENLPLRQALDFYHHEKGWSNRLVAGDSLLVMNSLLTKESMGGKVQMIYIDPPYGIKYGSNFQPFTNKRDVKDRKDIDLTQEPEMIKAFRDTWELGIHSYLSYLRDRLILVRELITNSGSVFLQIGDENVHLVRNVLDDVFGPENFVAQITVRVKSPLSVSDLARTTDFVIWYCKNKSNLKFRKPKKPKVLDDHPEFSLGMAATGRSISRSKIGKNEVDGFRFYTAQNLGSSGYTESCMYSFNCLGKEYKFPNGKSWKTHFSGMSRLHKAGRLEALPGSLRWRYYYEDSPTETISDIWADTFAASDKVYVVQTSQTVIERCLLMTTDPGDLVLDPTCGSGTTAFVAEKWGRRWITCDTSRVAVTLAKQRLMTASFDYYALRYPQEGLKGGFDYETVPHITLKSIANNPDIDTIYDDDYPKIAAALDSLNRALQTSPPKPIKPTQGVRKGKLVDLAKGETLHEWEVPFDWPNDWPKASRAHFDAFHAARQAMQRRMDQSIAAHADQETLYDKPRIDKSKLRITGPFSVEAVPAPTVLSLDESMPSAVADVSIGRSGETSRQALWREELLNTGVRGKGGAMLRFAEFETLPGLKYVHASGSLVDTGERVVVSFGPEHAALEQRQVELALDEAQTLRPSPKIILFCAFTFDPEAAKDIDEVSWPGVTLLKTQMNTDLLTEDLKKKRASNQSFWLMGQPDIELRKRSDGLWEVEVNGFDYFDPKAGDLVSGGKKQIAMWSLDVDYDNRSLMPHQVFFPMAGAKAGWNRLKKTVRAELDEDLLEQFHGTVSLPFESGDNGMIAVKIVDDRGIESLKILALED